MALQAENGQRQVCERGGSMALSSRVISFLNFPSSDIDAKVGAPL